METEVKKKAGRKPGKDNKLPLTIYIERSVINDIGGGDLDSGKNVAREEAARSVYSLRDEIKREILNQ